MCHWPRLLQEEVVTLTREQLNWVLDGYDTRTQLAPIKNGQEILVALHVNLDKTGELSRETFTA
jgi:hypothetical protein